MALDVLNLITSLIHLPLEPHIINPRPPMLDRHTRTAVAGNKEVVDALLCFYVRHAVKDPQTDIQWVAVRAWTLIVDLLGQNEAVTQVSKTLFV